VSFPGGHVDEGETAVEAVMRECEEELGQIVDDKIEILVFSFFDLSFSFFFSREKDLRLSQSQELWFIHFWGGYLRIYQKLSLIQMRMRWRKSSLSLLTNSVFSLFFQFFINQPNHLILIFCNFS